MNEHATQLLAWNQECVQLCRSLQEALQGERRSLISFQMAELAEATIQKSQLGRSLASRRQKMREQMLIWFGTTEAEALEEKLPEAYREQWALARQEWDAVWHGTHSLCEQNQRFMRHSLKNLGMMVDHFKRLIGEKSTYSAKGMKVDKPFQGKVIEGRF